MSKLKIKFGTSGWRGIIAEEFTFDNLRLVTQAISDYLKQQGSASEYVAVGYDTRFQSEDFAKASSEVLAANGFKVIYSDVDVPTPVISHYVIEKKLAGAINITASHNPPRYSGIKFSPDWGGPALPETTALIEKLCSGLQESPAAIKKMDFDEACKSGKIVVKDFSKEYIGKLKAVIDIGKIRDITLIYDAMHGAGRHYIPELLKGADLENLNLNRDPLFDGHRPEPAEEYLDIMIDKIRNSSINIGLATDGDADRFGIVDSSGDFISPNQVLALALYHLYKKGYRGVAVRSVMTSSFMDAVAKARGVEVIETPVGFKYIGDISSKREMIVGGEESGGLTIGGHVPEKDGILACLLMAELVASEGKSLQEIIKQLFEEVGTFCTYRNNYTVNEDLVISLKQRLAEQLPDKIGSSAVKEVKKLDGLKFILENNSWLGLRFSGTEPVVRVYVETPTEERASEILSIAEKEFGLK